jgi:hypothetical protein
MKKIVKKITVKSPVKKTVTKKPIMKMGGAKKSLPKAQAGKQTPFQGYMKTPGAVASDTTMKTIQGYYPSSPEAKNPVNQKSLENAWEKTYGQDWRGERYSLDPNETMDQYKRRMGPGRKKGGAVKKVTAKKVMVKSKKK